MKQKTPFQKVMAERKTKYETLLQRLGALDKERREVLNDLRNSPQHIIKMVNDKLATFIKEGRWFLRKNALNQEAYFSLNSFKINERSLNQTGRGSVLIKIDLIWDFYDYNSLDKKQAVEGVTISAFNELDAQVLNGRVPTNKFSEKIIKKNVLTAQKKEMEEKLKKIKLEIAAI